MFHIRRIVILISACTFLLTACVSIDKKQQSALADIQRYTIPYFAWMDKYYTDKGEKRFFNIDKLMQEQDLKRYQAVELQNRYRDIMLPIYRDNNCDKSHLSETDEPYNVKCVPEAVRSRVFAGILEQIKKQNNRKPSRDNVESGWIPEHLEDVRFIVVFDLDETLFYHDRKKNILYLSPGWKAALNKVHDNHGKIIFFTAKPDIDTYRLLNEDVGQVTYDAEQIKKPLTPQLEKKRWVISAGKPIKDFVNGVFTNNHLTIYQATKEVTAPVLNPSKDLRLIDPSLKKVVIIDNDASRIWQLKNLRYVKPWIPRSVNKPEQDGVYNEFYKKRLIRAVDEIIESVEWMEHYNKGKHENEKKSLQDAFLPYSYAARPTTQELAQVIFNRRTHNTSTVELKQDMAWSEAVNYIRLHPEIVGQ